VTKIGESAAAGKQVAGEGREERVSWRSEGRETSIRFGGPSRERVGNDTGFAILDLVWGSGSAKAPRIV
jgi:hypothetical protein